MFHIGCDPEVFVGDLSGVKSIVGRVGGTKQMPRELPLGEGFAVQEDNVALEFNIPPSPSKQLFVENMTSAMGFLEMLVADQGLQFVKSSAISFPSEELQTPESQEFGCDPDFNAYTGRRNPRPKAEDKNLRSCGGHVHIGTRGTKYENCDLRSIIKACDLTMSIPAVFMDTGVLRKSLYGKAGAYRQKSYGCEYRSMSNFWIFDKKLQEWVYDNTERALEMVYNGVSFAEDENLIEATINGNIAKGAEYLIGKYSLQVL